ncbi:asparagine synthase (glutamine-hydrolyzing) [Amycolatopsis sp. PS_44_ISF1]|uniref:asparagine synthase (glutamine-hydrolyzing) n=1 Tax=Amycolatopsis sp. PS_44_ISF1 TaxID=2974917 RepID=UPI0028DD69A3|nr:asparagine synthase (glutamine-hydrolyzing) [Amycolatopsis sp. PS_44_ISF1]MDT8915993.1 asparagine synthase (glutamine-hydrolyzing) [Amycolatopsis sp. PS_44_ISF1]
MCGIAGWIELSRSAAGKETDLERMTRTLVRRGPDGGGLWTDRHVGLGHRRLAVLDVHRGAQPMVAGPSGQPHAVLCYSGEVYNFRELRTELTARGHRFRTHCDTEVVLNAYLEWGVGFVERLRGMFAFALWDPRVRRLLLVRDRLGVKPLYYACSGEAVLFASEPKAVLAHPGFTARLDHQGLADLLGLVKTPGVTPFRDLYEVPPGHMLTVDDRGSRLSRYWHLPTVSHEDDIADTTTHVRELLFDIVREQLVTDVPLCSLLSGGLDSSALTAIATDVLDRAGKRPIRSFSVDFVGSADDFRTSEFRPERDNPYALQVAEHLGTAHQTITLPAEALTEHGNRNAVLGAHDLPLTFGDVDTSLYLLFSAIRERSTVALSGESADEVFGGYHWFHDPGIVGTADFPWLSTMQFVPERMLTAEFREHTRFGEYRADCYRQAIGEVEYLPGEDAQDRRMREFGHLHLTRWLPVLLDRKDRLSMAAGLEVRVPFCDHRLVEYVHNIPWKIKTHDGREKSVLRGAAAGLLPKPVLNRRKSPYPTTADTRYERDLRQRAGALLAENRSAALEVIDAGALRELLDRPEGYFDTQLRRNPLETAVSLGQWYQEQWNS